MNNRLCTSSNKKNQAYVQDGRVNIQGKSSGYIRNSSRNARNQARNVGNQGVTIGNGHYARDCSKPRVQDSKYFREQMLLAAKDEAGVHLDEEENDFMLMSANGDDQLEELNASVIMMARLQPADNDSDVERSMILTFLASDIIFDDPYMEDKSGQTEHANDAHDQKLDDFESLI
ncbi:hypothetical protein Tco_0753739 [Tanacetum coccineum]